MEKPANDKLQYDLLRFLNDESQNVKKLSTRSNKRAEEISKQLGYLRSNYLVYYEEGYDDFFGRRTHVYHLSTLGKMSLNVVNEFSMISSSLNYYVPKKKKDDEIMQKNTLVLKRESTKHTTSPEPLRYCKLQYSFHDQPLLSSLKRSGISIKKQNEVKTSNERIDQVANKRADLAIVPDIALLDNENKKILRDVIVIGILKNNCVPPKLIKDDKQQEIIYSGGFSRKKMASTYSKKTNNIPDDELLKGVKDGDYASFVMNDPDAMLFQIESNKTAKERFLHDSFIITNNDGIAKNGYLKTIYKTHEYLIRSTNTSDLLRDVGHYTKDELLPYIKDKAKIFSSINEKLNLEFSSQMFS